MPPSQLIYAKKCILPSRAAHVLQSLNMAYAFAEQGVPTVMWPGFNVTGHPAFRQSLERDYGLAASRELRLQPLFGRHKGLYGLGFRMRLLKAWLTAPKGAVFYARDITEALLLARFRRLLPVRRPVFYELHELLGEQHQALNTGRAPRLRRMEAEVLANVDGVVCISPVLTDALAESYGYSGPVTVAPMGYNHRLFRPCADADFSGTITVAYAGSLYESKGVHNLVRAMAHLPGRFRLLVVGGNPSGELERLRELARGIPDGEGRVEFCGHLPQSELGARLASCSIMAIPQSSTAEFFSPIKLYESIGMALPLVVTPIPALTSVLEHGVDALVAEDSTPQGLARALADMASDQARARAMQARCRQRAASSTWLARAGACLEFMDRHADVRP